MSSIFIPLHGRLDVNTSANLQADIEKTLASLDPTPQNVILGVSEVTYLSSAGLRLLLVIHRRCLEQQGTLALSGAGHPVQEVLNIAGLDDVFPQFANEAEALRSLGN